MPFYHPSQFKKAIGGLLVLMVLGAPLSGWAQADTSLKVVEVIASQSMRNSNMASAREKALAECLVSAVAKAVEEIVALDSQVDDFARFNEALYDRTDAFVQGYRVLAEHAGSQAYRAIVQVTIAMDKVAEELESAGVTDGKAELPRLLFFIAEQKVNDVLPRYWWGEDLVFVMASAEAGLVESVQQQGFEVINHTQFVDPLELSLAVSLEQAAAVASRLLADVVVIGEAKAQEATNVMDQVLKSYKASVSIKAYDVESGQEMAFVTRSAVTTGENPDAGSRKALYNAGSLAGEVLVQQIEAAVNRSRAREGVIEIVVQGTGELVHFVRFRQALRQISGVKALRIKEMKADESIIEAEYEGSSKSLAEALMLKTFTDFGIHIYDLSTDKLRVELVSQ